MSDQHVLSGGGVSFVPKTANEIFDIKSEAGALTLLKSVHRSMLEPDVKNALRDAVFSYRQNQSEESFDEVCQLFASVGVDIAGAKTLDTTEKKKEDSELENIAKSKHKLGLSRPKPSFGVIQTEPAEVTEEKVSAKEENAPQPQAPATTHTKVADESQAQLATDSDNAIVPATQTTNEDQKSTPEQTQSEQPQAESHTTAHDTVSVEHSENHTNFSERIKAIKKSINDRVGNPVHLIDSHNEIGREYMSALLDAMKKSNGGQPEELVSAMDRLEKAYQDSIRVLDEEPTPAVPDTTPAPSSPAPSIPDIDQDQNVAPEEKAEQEPAVAQEHKSAVEEIESETSPAPTIEQSPVSSPDTPVKELEESVLNTPPTDASAPREQSKDIHASPKGAKIPLIKKLTSVSFHTPKPKVTEKNDSTSVHDDGDDLSLPYSSDVNSLHEDEATHTVTPRAVTLKNIKSVVPPPPPPPSPPQPTIAETPSENTQDSTPAQSTPSPNEAQDKKIIENAQEAQIPERKSEPHIEGSNPVSSVAKTKQVEELLHTQMLERIERDEIQKKVAEESMDPIMVSEVTAGLKQLLSEWDLFKSSGFFGTGPSGIDHELYKRLSSMPMQAVVAGRFDGVNPQIRQSLSDYMNGWRYEEGVVHDYGETFEHYLRRVIRHILDKQAKK